MNVYDRSGKLVTRDYEKKTANIAENSKAAKARADAMSAQWEQERARREAEKQQEKARKEAEARARKEAAEREKVRKATEEFNRRAQEAAKAQQEEQRRQQAKQNMQSIPALKRVDAVNGFNMPSIQQDNTALNQGPISLPTIDPDAKNRIIPRDVNVKENSLPVALQNNYKIATETDLDKQIQGYLSAGKLTKEQKKEAKNVLKQEKQRRKELFASGNTDAMIPGTDEYQRNKNFDDLTAKVNSNFGYGLVSPFAKISDLALKGIEKLTGTEDSQGAEVMNQQMRDFYNRDKLAAEQAPIAHGVGNFVGQAGIYSATNPLFDAGAEAVGVTSNLGKFAVNQLAQNAQDLALDTAPTYNQNISMGMSEDEAKKEALKGIGLNAAGNLIMGAGSELLGNFLPKLKANKGADAINQIDDQIQTLQKQSDDATAEIQRLSNQVPEVAEAPVDVPKLEGPAEAPVNSLDNITPQKVANSPIEAGVDNAPINSEVLPKVDVDRLIAEPQKAIGKAKRQSFTDKKGSLHRYEQLYDDSPELTEVEIYKDKNNKWRVGKHWEDMGADRDIARFDDLLENSEGRAMSFDTKEDAVKEFEKRLKTRKYSDYVPEFDPDEALPFLSKKNTVNATGNNFSVMNEDTGINGFRGADETPEIRMDATDGIKGDGVIPETNVERLTEQPDELTAEMRERGFHESSRNRGAIPDDVKQALKEQDSIDRNMYSQLHNWQTEDHAIELWDEINTFDEAEQRLKSLANSHDAAAVPFARRLVSAYSESGQTENALRVMDEVAESLTKAGQYTQAAVLGLTKDNPLTALKYAEKEINNINIAGKEKYGKRWKDFIMSEDEKSLFTNLKPGDETGIQNAFETIGKRIEHEYPATLREQLKEATHVAMLLNPRTMSRNVIANVPTLGMRAAGNRVEAVGQRLAHLVNKDIDVNQALLGGGIKDRKLAKEVYEKPEIQALFDALDGKYNETNRISKHIKTKQMFKGNNPIDGFIDGILGGYWNENGGLISKANKALGAEGNKSALEALRQSTYKLLELGDTPFVKENFVARLASEIKTKGWKSADDITPDAIQRALKESLEATYKDPNRLSKILLNMKKDMGIVGEGIAPFGQTLGSIGMRSYEYSPAGAMVSLGRIASSAAKNDSKAVAEGIRQLSKGLTGSGMILAGMALFKSGLITGDYSDDPNIKEAQKRAGFKPYAIHLGDKYYTFDWMQPASVSGIIGIALAQAVEDKSNPAEALGEGAIAAGNAWFNQSAFKSLAELLGSENGQDEQGPARKLADMLLEMPMRLIPSAVGATARTIDPAYRDTYDQTSYGNNYKNQVIAKIPGLSKKLPQSYDMWGQPRMRAGSTGEAAFQQYVNPGEYSEENLNDLDAKIKAIYDEYPDKRLYPDKIPYSISAGDFSMKLNNEQHSELTRVQGGYNSELATAMFDNAGFNSLSNESKAEVADSVYSAARDIAFYRLYGKEPTSDNKKALEVLHSKGKEEFINYLSRKEDLKSLGVDNSDKMQNLLAEGGKEAVQQYLDVKKKATTKNKSGKDDQKKADLMREILALPEDKQAAMYDAFGSNVCSTDKEKAAYEKGGAEAAINEYRRATAEAERKAAKDAAERKKDATDAGVSVTQLDTLQKQLADAGAINSPDTVKYYNHAKQTIPSLTTKEYAETVRHIGGEDKKISQKEMLNYFNTNNLDAETVNKYWNAYGEWKRVPKLKNGKWVAR